MSNYVNMNTLTPVSRRTDPKTVQLILARIVQGTPYKTISQEVGVSESGIKKIKKRNLVSLPSIRVRVVEEQGRYAARILQKTLSEIERRVDDSITGKSPLPIKELVSIAKETFIQAHVKNEEPVPDEKLRLTPEETAAITQAIKTDDYKTLQSLMFP